MTFPPGFESFTFLGFDKLYLDDTEYMSKIKMNVNQTISMNMLGVNYNFGYLAVDEIEDILNATSAQSLPDTFQNILDSKDQSEPVKKNIAFLGINSAIGNIKPIDPESPEEALGMKYSVLSESSEWVGY